MRFVPATNDLMVELARYQREKCLSPFPTHAKNIPLLLPIGTQKRKTTSGAVHALVKKVSSETAIRLKLRGASFEPLAALVEAASAPWLGQHCRVPHGMPS